MPIIFDIEKDSFYKEGLEKRLEEGREEEKYTLIVNMLKNGVLTLAQIAEIAQTPKATVGEIAKDIER